MYLSFNCLSNGNTFSTEKLCMSICGKFFSISCPSLHCTIAHYLFPFLLTSSFSLSPTGQFSSSTTETSSIAPSQSSHTLSATQMPVSAAMSTLPRPTHTSLSVSTHSSLKIASTTYISSTTQTPTTTPPTSDQSPSIGAKTTPVSYKNVHTSSDESPQPTVQDIDTSSAPPSGGTQGILLLTVLILVVQELY